MLITVKVREDQISEEFMSFLKKHENNGVEIVEIRSDNGINVENLASEVEELMFNITVDHTYKSDKRNKNKIILSEKYKLTELQVLKEIIRFFSSIDIYCSFEVSDNFYIDVSRYKENSKEMISELQDIVNEVCKKYAVRNDLVIVR